MISRYTEKKKKRFPLKQFSLGNCNSINNYKEMSINLKSKMNYED